MKTLIEYALKIVGTPYLWGGAGPDGYDCSGLVQEILASVGAHPPVDSTAQGIYAYYREKGEILKRPTMGALVFYGKTTKSITHIAFAIDEFRIVEAGGGGHRIKTVADAYRSHAFVRIRRFDHRKDYLLSILPKYEFF